MAGQPDIEKAMADDFAGMLLDLMKSKEAILSTLVGNIQFAEQTKSLQNFVNFIDKAEAEGTEVRIDQLAGMVRTLVKTARKQSEAIKDLSMVALVAVGSDDFSTQCAQMANKLGRGQEALQAMMNEKLGRT